MPSDAAHRHDRLTIVSMAVIASAVATLLHEGVGHGLTAFVRGDVPTELTSNHLSSLHPDRMVDAAGTIVNLIAGVVAHAGRVTDERARKRPLLFLDTRRTQSAARRRLLHVFRNFRFRRLE